jgi:diguanylate cyclase (GGDEF)-like protein
MRKGRFAGLESADPAAIRLREWSRLAAAVLAAAAPAIVALLAFSGADTPIVAAVAGIATLLVLLALYALRRGAHLEVEAIAVEEDERARRLVADFEESGCGWFWETNADGRLSYLSEPVARAIEQDRGTLLGRRFEELLLLEESSGDAIERPTLGFHLSSRFPFANAIVTPSARKDLCWCITGRPRFDEVGRFLGFRGVGLNLSESQRAEIASSRLAGCDSLTGLANRARMRAMLDEALANSASRREGCGLLLIDLDRFKQVNDTLGHPIGDLLLKEVAQRLSAVVEGEGQVGRLGGDEFEVLLPGVDEEGRLAALAEELVATISAPYVVRGHTLLIGTSIGISISRPGKTLADALIKQSDLALYAAKRAGRGTYRFFEPEMDALESERRILENDLKVAINKGQLRLAFQPVVNAASEDLVGFEALLRWSHPVRGLLAPADFLPLAQASGLISGIGEWVVREACAEAAKWPKHLRLAINVSQGELEHPKYPAIVAAAIGAADLEPERLELDIAETVLLADTESIRSVLGALHGLGIRLALDDFGEDGASLLSFKAPALDRVKIHPSLLRKALPEGSRAFAVVSAIVALADSLGMGVTAESVETIDELDLVRRLGCSDIQGFLFGRPMSADDAAKLAADSKSMTAGKDVEPRPPRHSLLRRGSLRWAGGTLPVRLRNISAEGAMIEGVNDLRPESDVELDLADGLRLSGRVRWSRDGRMGLKFAEAFDLRRLGSLRTSKPGALRPDYLGSELDPNSPWAARKERLTIKEVKRK